MRSESELQARSAAIEEQARLVETCADPATRAAALDLLRSVMDLHKSALERILEMVAERDGNTVEAFTRDPLVHSVLMLHDLHPDALETRVERALEQLRPKLQRHQAEARLVGIEDHVVRVSLSVASHCGSTDVTLQASVEEALLEAAPDAEIIIDTPAQTDSSFVSIDALRPATQAAANDGIPAAVRPA